MKTITLAAIIIAVLGSAELAAQELAPAQEFSHHQPPPNVPQDRIERVTGDLSEAIVQWKGVRSCSDADRAAQARQAAYERWIGQQTLSRPRKLLLVSGYGAGQWNYEIRTRRRVRSCKGWYTSAPVYAHFY